MSDISTLLNETRSFPPPPAFAASAIVNDPDVYARAAADPEAYWAEQAAMLDWYTPWHTVCEWKPPHARWFLGGTINASFNCLDRHLAGARRNKAAIVWEGEPGDHRTLTYWELHRDVCQFANVLKKLGVARGDRVGIYLP